MGRLRCNIDRRGRIARGASGVICLGLSVSVALWGIPGEMEWLRWLLVVVLALLGGFQVFEACAGWCVTRALGFKTPM